MRSLIFASLSPLLHGMMWTDMLWEILVEEVLVKVEAWEMPRLLRSGIRIVYSCGLPRCYC